MRETLKSYWPILVFAGLVLLRYWGVLWSELFISVDHLAAYGLEVGARGSLFYTYCDGILGGVKVLPMFWLNPLTIIPAIWGMALASLAGCIGMWLYLKRGYGGFFGGVAYGFTGLMVSLVFAGHGGKMWVMGLFPLGMWVVDSLRNWKWGVFLGVIGWLMLSFHVQMAYYAFVFMTVYWIIKSRKGLKWVLLGILVSGVLFTPQFLMTQKISSESTRGTRSFERAITYSMPPEEVMCAIDQNFKGELWDYHGRKEFKQHTEAMGVACVILALLGLVVWRSWAMFGVGLISLIFSFGGFTPLYKLIYLIPPNGMFRSPSMAFFGFVFVVVVFASKGARMLKWGSIICALLIYGDLYYGTMKYTQPVSFEDAYGNVRDCAEWLQKDKSEFRIFTPHVEIGDNRFLLWGIKSLNGYYPFPRKAFVDSVGGNILPDFSKLTLRTARNYGVKYVVSKEGPEGQLVFRGKYYNVYGIGQ